MVALVNVADLKNPETGLTYRQENAAKQHNIPLWSLVEVKGEGLRLYVCEHNRDCDQTPLYSLTMVKQEKYETWKQWSEEKDLMQGVYKTMLMGAVRHGLDEGSLTVIHCNGFIQGDV